jgi:hypothetical protein
LADPSRVRLTIVLDCLIAFFLVLAVAIELTGGFQTSPGGFRLSVRSVDRAVLAALGLFVVRRLAVKRLPPFAMRESRLARLRARMFDREADSNTGPGRHRRTGLVAAAAGLCAIGAVLLFPQLRHMGSVPDFGDPLFSMWRIGWVFQQLQGDPRPLFDANIFHPERLTLTYSDSMLLTSLLAAPLLALGLHPVVAYNVLFVSSFVLSGLALYALVARLTGSRRAAFVSAVVFGFYPYRFEHYSHLELQMTFWMPLALLAVHRFVETAGLRYALGAAAALVAQLYSSMYYGVFLGIFVVAVGLVLSAFRVPRASSLVRPAAIAAVVAILAALPLAGPYVAARGVKGDRGHDAVRSYSARASDYLRAHQRSSLYGGRLLPDPPMERALFPGVLPILLGAAALAPPLGPLRLAYATGLLVAFDGSLGFNGLLYPYLYEWVAPVRSMRVPARFSILAGLSLAVLAGFAMRRLLRNRGRASGALLTTIVVGAAMADVWPRLELRPVWREPPAVYAAIVDPHSVLAEFPINPEVSGFADNTAFMYFSLWHWRSMVNGYSGFYPPSYEALVDEMNWFPGKKAVDALALRGVTHLSVNCALYSGPCAAVLDQLDSLPSLRLVAEQPWQGQVVRIYALQR